jgi:hypothetical protein
MALRRRRQIVRRFGELGGQQTGFFPAHPFRMASLLPFGKVLFGDGAAAELFH